MYETRREYESIVAIKVCELSLQLGHSIFNGDEGLCPRCGHGGTFDLGIGFDLGENGIYYSTITWEWRCRRCDYQMP